jgi:hypothetical protein
MSWKIFRDASREKYFFLIHDDDLRKDFLFAPPFIVVDLVQFGSNVWASLTIWLEKNSRIYACEFRRLLRTSMDVVFP